MDLTGKVAIVTGASRGLGRQLAHELGRRGATVVVAARTVDARRTLGGTIAQTVADLEADGGKALAVQCDVAEPADLRRLVSETVGAFGRIDIVINNAADMVGQELEPMVESMLSGGARPPIVASSDEVNLAGWLQQFAVNVHAPYLLMQLATPYMRDQGGGFVINISSDAADIAPVDGAESLEAARQAASTVLLGYGTTKAALNRLTNRAALDLARDNIAVIAFAPGPIRTELVDLLADGGLLRVNDSYMSMDELASTIVDAIDSTDPLRLSGQIIHTHVAPTA
jgi:NAD(P)-dependent dehydrogenase (short-subunit alcohol dehydrogenase family)